MWQRIQRIPHVSGNAASAGYNRRSLFWSENQSEAYCIRLGLHSLTILWIPDVSGNAAQAGYNRLSLFWSENLSEARLAQLAERKALNLVVVGSSPTVGALRHASWAACTRLPREAIINT